MEVEIAAIYAKRVVGHISIGEQIFEQLYSQFDKGLALYHNLVIFDRRFSTSSYTF